MKKGRWIAAEHIKARVLFLSEKDRQNISKKSKNNTDFLLKIAVSAGLKFSKKAVERNRIRRQISAVLESLVGRVSHLNGAFIMFAGIYYGAMYGGSTTSILITANSKVYLWASLIE